MISLGPVLVGMAVGVVLAAPVGPMGMLALLKLSEERPREAYAIGLGAALADGLLALIAAVGVGSVHALIVGHLPSLLQAVLGWLLQPRVVEVILATLLLGMAAATWRGRAVAAARPSGAGALATGLLLTLLHPANIAAYGAAFLWLQGAGWAQLGGLPAQLAVGGGVLAGTLAMWLGLLAFATPRVERWGVGRLSVRIRRATALILAVAGVIALGRGLI